MRKAILTLAMSTAAVLATFKDYDCDRCLASGGKMCLHENDYTQG